MAGEVAIVTGAAQGMGAAHARALATEGACVLLTDVNAEDGSAPAGELGTSTAFASHDVRREDDWARVVAEAESRFGAVTVLVNNAGVIGPVAELTDFAAEDFLDVCAVNQLGVFLGMRSVIPAMRSAGHGSIINISSIAGMVGPAASSNAAYVASKFAVRGMSKYAAVKYGPDNIRVNSVHPGYIKTPMMVAATGESGGGAADAIPLGRMAEPHEVAALIVFLASTESSFINGAEHVIDGGMIAG